MKNKKKLAQKELAAKWGISQTLVSKYARMGCPWDQPDSVVAAWIMKHAKRKNADLKVALRKAMAETPARKRTAAKKVPDKARGKKQIKSLEAVRDYYNEQLISATETTTPDHETIKFWNDLLIKTEKCLREAQAHEKKLGIEKGEMLARAEVERILENICWAGNASCDKFGKQIAERLSNKAPADIYRILAPLLTALMIFEPLRKLKTAPGNINLPEWVIKCFETERKQYLK